MPVFNLKPEEAFSVGGFRVVNIEKRPIKVLVEVKPELEKIEPKKPLTKPKVKG